MQLSCRNLSILRFTPPAVVKTYLLGRLTRDRTVSLPSFATLACAPILLYAFPLVAMAQGPVATLYPGSSTLPETPLPQGGVQNGGGPAIPTEGSASLSGFVLDTRGAAITDAQVRLMTNDGLRRGTVFSGDNGAFTFGKLSPGSYLITVEAKGFGPFTSAEISVATHEDVNMPPISLTVSAATTDVTVRPIEVIAAEQIKEEEHQRVFGVIPNFYTSYTYDAVPLTTKQKYSLAAREELDWTTFVGAGIASGVQQANNSYAGYGQGAAGYGKRYAAAFGDGLFINFFSHAVYPSIFHQDPRYFYQGSGTIKSRALHAASFAIFTRGDHRQRVPNYSYIFAIMTTGALANLYYPHADRGAHLVFTTAALGIAGRAGGTILREFLLKPLTTNVHGNGKP